MPTVKCEPRLGGVKGLSTFRLTKVAFQAMVLRDSIEPNERSVANGIKGAVEDLRHGKKDVDRVEVMEAEVGPKF